MHSLPGGILFVDVRSLPGGTLLSMCKVFRIRYEERNTNGRIVNYTEKLVRWNVSSFDANYFFLPPFYTIESVGKEEKNSSEKLRVMNEVEI